MHSESISSYNKPFHPDICPLISMLLSGISEDTLTVAITTAGLDRGLVGEMCWMKKVCAGSAGNYVHIMLSFCGEMQKWCMIFLQNSVMAFQYAAAVDNFTEKQILLKELY